MKTIGLDISVLNDYHRTGIGVYTYELINALLKKNSEDKFILFGISTFQTFQYLSNLEFKKFPNVEMKIYKFPARLFRRTFLLWQNLGWPNIELFIGSVDIFHCFNWFMPPQKFGKKVATVFDMTSTLFPDLHDKKTTQLDKLRFARIADIADLVLAISENSKLDFLRLNPRGKVDVVYPAVADKFNMKIDQEENRKVLKKYDLQSGYFLSVSTLEPRKNLKNLIEGFLKSKLNIPLVLVGKMGWKNQDLLQIIQKHPQIRMLGYISDNDLKTLYQEALGLVYIPYYEGFGIPILEALKCGTPVISSDTSSLPEVGGEAVIYVNPNNIEGISLAMRRLYKDKSLHKKLSRKGLLQSQKFSWSKSAEKLNKLYKEILI